MKVAAGDSNEKEKEEESELELELLEKASTEEEDGVLPPLHS